MLKKSEKTLELERKLSESQAEDRKREDDEREAKMIERVTELRRVMQEKKDNYDWSSGAPKHWIAIREDPLDSEDYVELDIARSTEIESGLVISRTDLRSLRDYLITLNL